MDIKWPSLPPQALPPPLAKALANTPDLVGKLLDAVVMRSSPRATGGFEISLKLPQLQQVLTLPTDKPLPPGTQLVMQVLDNQRIRLSPATAQPAPEQAPAASRGSDVISSALREALPMSRPMAQAMEGLAQLMRKDAAGALPEAVRSALSEVLRSLPDRTALATPEGIRNALRNSGVFLEQGLASRSSGQAVPAAAGTAPPPPANTGTAQATVPAPATPALAATTEEPASDLKAALLRAAATLLANQPGSTAQQPAAQPGQQPSPPALLPALARLLAGPARHAPTADAPGEADAALPALVREALQQVSGALANTQIRQLAPQQPPGPDGLVTLLVVDLPVRDQEHLQPWQLTVKREARRAEKPEMERAWIVNMGLELEALGPLQAHFVLQQQRLKTTLWAEQPPLLALLEQSRPLLEQRMTAAGILVEAIECKAGSPAQSEARISTRLVDVRT